jgi:hypothetical protein
MDPAIAISCDTCHRLLQVKICSSNKNGNAGRAFTRSMPTTPTAISSHGSIQHTLLPLSSPASSPTRPAVPSIQPKAAPPATQNPSGTTCSMVVSPPTMPLLSSSSSPPPTAAASLRLRRHVREPTIRITNDGCFHRAACGSPGPGGKTASSWMRSASKS